MSVTPENPPAAVEQAYATLMQLADVSALLGIEGLRAGATASVDAGSELTAPAGGEAEERRSRLAEARYQVLIEQIPAVTFLASLAGDKNEIYVSPQIESLLGFTQEEWVSDPILWYRVIHPEDSEQLSHEFATACVTGQPYRGVVRVYTRGGELRWVHAEARLVRDEHGQLLFLQGVGFDVTAQFRAQEAREQLIREQVARAEADRERQYLQELLTALPAAISVLRGSDRVVEFLNPVAAELAGGAAELIGKPWAEAFPEFGDGINRAMETVLATREPYQVREYRTDSPRWGGERFFNFICEPLRNPQGGVPLLLTHAMDVTEQVLARRRVEDLAAQLTTANKELEAFSYSVSHDLRAPLRSIDGFSQAVLKRYADQLDAQGQDYLQRVCSASQRMAELIDDLLTLSRVTRAELRRDPVDLSALVASVAAELQQRQPERRVELVIAEGLMATGDARLLRAVLENLLGNAWKFTSKRDPARIEFSSTQIDGQPAYFVRDNGAGFDMSYADKLFSPFQRLHSADEFEGTGIGLATVQRIIHRHGGRIWAEGIVGQGATFYFTL